MSGTTADIIISGKIDDVEVANELAKAVENQGLTLDWGSSAQVTRDDVLRDILEAGKEVRHLHYFSGETEYGILSALEKRVQELGLSFVRQSGATDEYDRETSYFNPGMTAPEAVSSDSDGKAVITVDEIARQILSGNAQALLQRAQELEAAISGDENKVLELSENVRNEIEDLVAPGVAP
jgi:hypothetical protein